MAVATIPGDLIRREFALSPSTSKDGKHTAVIAVNDDVGDGMPISLRSMDLETYQNNPVVMFKHGWAEEALPVGRSTAIRWEPRGLVADFEFLPGDPFAARVANAWKRGFLRAASIGAKPNQGGGLRLAEWSIVAVPADVDAVRSLYRDGDPPTLSPAPRDSDMDATEVEAIVNRALEQKGPLDMDALTGKFNDVVKREIGDAFKQRDDAAEATRAAEAKTAEAEAKAKTDREASEAGAESRAEMLVMVRGLIPKDTVVRGMSNKDLLVLAAGDEVADAKDRSEDYLFARVEAIAARREAANGSIVSRAPAPLPAPGAPPPPNNPVVAGITRSVSVLDLQRMRAQRPPQVA